MSGKPCCAIGAREDAYQVDAALRAAKEGVAGAESLNAIHRRIGIGKALLIKHRNECPIIPWEPGFTDLTAPNRSAEPPREPLTERAKLQPAKTLEFVDRDEIPLVSERVDEIMNVMIADRWIDGSSFREYSERWNVSGHTVRNHATEARRRLKSFVNKDFVSQRLSVSLCNALDGVEASDEEPTRKADAVAKIAKAWAPIVGALAPTKNEHTGKDGAPLNLPPRAAILLERAKGGDMAAQTQLRQWIASSEPDAPLLVDAAVIVEGAIED